jgi:hypothetical protein
LTDICVSYILVTYKEFIKSSPLRGSMPLTRYERKERLPYGEQKKIAADLGLSSAFISRVLNDKTDGMDPEKVRQVRVEIARRLRPRTAVADAFPEAAVA